MTDHTTETGQGVTADGYVQMFDLHVEVLRANRLLDDAFPPYTADSFQAIRDSAEVLREQAEALRDHMDTMRTPPGQGA